jgi:hypothetical protein
MEGFEMDDDGGGSRIALGYFYRQVLCLSLHCLSLCSRRCIGLSLQHRHTQEQVTRHRIFIYVITPLRIPESGLACDSQSTVSNDGDDSTNSDEETSTFTDIKSLQMVLLHDLLTSCVALRAADAAAASICLAGEFVLRQCHVRVGERRDVSQPNEPRRWAGQEVTSEEKEDECDHGCCRIKGSD